jgi:beta-glucosidase-like glycosyl hydrolase
LKKEIINNIFVCDYCKKDINIRNVYKNDGSFQKDYVSLHGKDVCKHCALEVLYKLSSKIKEEDIDKSVTRILRIKEKYNISDKKKINGCNIEELNKQIEELNSILN